jgi:hypothetical protein
VSSEIDLIYDRLVAEEKLKDGTKYERLAAIVYKLLTEQVTVHDLKLRGDTGVKHQIDAVVGENRKHILVEAKDLGRNVDLPIVRNFWAAVEDIKPDEAFVVTTVGFSPQAVQYAEAKGIRLALLRPPQDEDWDGLIKKVVLEVIATGQAGLVNVNFNAHSDEAERIASGLTGLGVVETAQVRFANATGEERLLLPILVQQLDDDYGAAISAGEATIGRTNTFDEPTWLHAPGISPLRVTGWKWEAKITTETIEVVVGDGVGGLVAELALRTIDDSIRKIFTNKQIAAWTFDGHNVVPRDT